jgi:phosphate uptake regulator
MRATFHAKLDELISDLARMVWVAAELMTDASSALHHGDLTLADRVVGSQVQMTATLKQVQRRCVALLALQTTVATDLRALITTLRAVDELEPDVCARPARREDRSTQAPQSADSRWPCSTVGTDERAGYSPGA